MKIGQEVIVLILHYRTYRNVDYWPPTSVYMCVNDMLVWCLLHNYLYIKLFFQFFFC